MSDSDVDCNNQSSCMLSVGNESRKSVKFEETDSDYESPLVSQVSKKSTKPASAMENNKISSILSNKLLQIALIYAMYKIKKGQGLMPRSIQNMGQMARIPNYQPPQLQPQMQAMTQPQQTLQVSNNLQPRQQEQQRYIYLPPREQNQNLPVQFGTQQQITPTFGQFPSSLNNYLPAQLL
ncbi:hypothetical protein Ciccas_004998 [Cichlidogyrus casuarinus]|uniref:Uncharacterized protein n=1 Tax=Cichlidogyrus casuarinus TaxID=1844966 RepID=A0ABD2Q9Y8_9PLAT